MGKMTSYILLMTGLVIAFYFAGLTDNHTATSYLLTLALNPENLPQADIMTIITSAILGLGFVATVIVGLTTRNTELTAATGVATYLFSLMIDFLLVYSKMYSYNRFIAMLIFAPILVLFIVTLFEWWRGRD